MDEWFNNTKFIAMILLVDEFHLCLLEMNFSRRMISIIYPSYTHDIPNIYPLPKEV